MNQHAHSHQTHTHILTKNAVAAAITVVMGGSLTHVHAALPNGALLNFAPGIPFVTGCSAGNFTGTSCTLGGTPYTAFELTDMGGSYFLMDQGNGNDDKVAISQFAPIQLGAIQTSSGQHTGTVNGTESPAIDNAWNFFNNTGMHTLASPISVSNDMGATQILDFSGWGVNWGEFGPGGLNPTIPMPGSATLVCSSAACADGDTYTLDMNVHVPQAFTSVPYSLHLEGTVNLPGGVPVAADDSSKTIIGNPVTINVLANDPVPADPIIPGSVAIDTQATNGTATDNANDTVTYTPNPGFNLQDTFVYTVDNVNGTSLTPTSVPPGAAGEQGIVTVDVQTNVAPVANDDLNSAGRGVSTTTVALDNAGGTLIVNVLGNDTDANNGVGLPGGIDITTVNVLSQPAAGACAANPDGTITYSQALPSVTESDSCTYEVSDIDINGALTSNTATVQIEVSAIQSDWDSNLDPDILPILKFDPGVPDASGNTALPPQSGSYFTMQVSAATTIYTTMTPGTDGGMLIGHDQIGGVSHTGAPTGNEIAVLDLGWNFFGNTGMTFTKNGGIVGNPDGTLDFSGTPSINNGQGRYQITWNGIPEIDLGGASQFPSDLGFAVINCDTTTPVDPANAALCANGDFFELSYDAHVPPGDPSGFGGVPYGLRMTGQVQFLDGRLQTSNGSITTANRDSATSLPADPDVQIQCAGDCFDYVVTGVTAPSVSVVLPLAGGIPKSFTDGSGNTVAPELRVLRNNVWGSFITNATNSASQDTVKSASMVSGGQFGWECPPPGVGYGPLTAGHQCVEVTIEDNGPNDKDPAVGTISDPSGIGVPFGAAFVDTRTSSHDSGCSLSANPSGPHKGGAWMLLAGLLGWLGWKQRKQRR